jgi:L-threonine-O-3-phosphate decarboxylase
MNPGWSESTAALAHGGRILAAARHYGIAPDGWLDLSTGINPHGWPVPSLPSTCWQRLPEDDDGLVAAARTYYGAAHILPVAGSQAALQMLPRLRPACRVGVLTPGYAEHALAWRRAGHRVQPVSVPELPDAVAQCDVMVLISPNNPTGERFNPERLLDWHGALAARGGWLVVDEAFMDMTPETSLCAADARTGLIVLRSLGKFFGLAGLRMGFVCAVPALLDRLSAALGPWAVSTPARHVACTALADRVWQADMRKRLAADGGRLHDLLVRHGLAPTGGCDLFQWVATPLAADRHTALARQGILTRYFDQPPSLRFGLPGSEPDWARLETALLAVHGTPTGTGSP